MPDLYGSTEESMILVDMFLDGTEDWRQKYLTLIYQQRVVSVFWRMHLPWFDPFCRKRQL